MTANLLTSTWQPGTRWRIPLTVVLLSGTVALAALEYQRQNRETLQPTSLSRRPASEEPAPGDIGYGAVAGHRGSRRPRVFRWRKPASALLLAVVVVSVGLFVMNAAGWNVPAVSHAAARTWQIINPPAPGPAPPQSWTVAADKAVISGDGSTLFAARDDAVSGYDVTTGARLWTIEDLAYPEWLTISGDGRRVAVVAGKLDTLLLLDGRSGRLLHQQDGYGYLSGLTLSPDGTVLVKVPRMSSNGRLDLIDVDTAEPIRSILLEGVSPTSVAFNAAGTDLAVGVCRGLPRIWHLQPFGPRNTVSRPLMWQDSCSDRPAFSPDGHHLAASVSAGNTERLYVWNLGDESQPPQKLGEYDDPIVFQRLTDQCLHIGGMSTVRSLPYTAGVQGPQATDLAPGDRSIVGAAGRYAVTQDFGTIYVAPFTSPC